jgi:hypothetical protein
MDPKTVLAHVRKLCDDIDAMRPVRLGLRRFVLPFAVPAALGIGIVGCTDSSPRDTDGDVDADTASDADVDGDAEASVDEICNNGLDDDGNGQIDCADAACADDDGCRSALPGCEPRVEYCEDGFDNDGNGDTDCEDLCCDAFCFYRDCPMCEYGIPFEPLDAELDCGDSRDEDCDGQTDCCDADCSSDPACGE